MLSTTIGQLLINDSLPDDLKDYSRKMDKKGVSKLLQEVAEKYPDKYKDITKKLLDVGRTAAVESGGYSIGLKSLIAPEKVKQLKARMQADIDKVMRSKLPEEVKQKAVIAYLQEKTKELETTLYDEQIKAKDPLAYQVLSGARGSAGNLRSVLGGDLLYEDHKGRVIPVPVMRSYAQGLLPHEYFAGSFGTRRGIITLKQSTQDAGFFSKQLNQAAHRLIVTAHDSDKSDDTPRGVVMPTDDPDNEGALLAINMGDYKRNTKLTPKILADLKSKGFDDILIRSPMVGSPPEGGLYATDVGVRERGGLPPIGDNVGMAAAQAAGEKTSQAQIGAKHTGGVAGAGAAQSGFKYINQAVQVPKTFTGGAAHADVDGKVGAIFDAPAGGKFVMIGGQKHYVAQGFDVKVKSGDTVEAGDVISDGLPNPAKIVEHKGVGEGRRYFVNIFRKLYKDSGFDLHRRNIELIARGLINHVQLDDIMGDYVPDDVVPYDVLEHKYQPRDGHAVVDVRNSINKYLEKPVLHYSIGTKIRPSMLKDLQKWNVKNVIVHNDPPPFRSVMVRAMENALHDPDWMTRQLGSNLRKGLLDATHRGGTSNELGTSFVPNLARGQDFGRVGKTKSWTRADIRQPEEFIEDDDDY